VDLTELAVSLLQEDPPPPRERQTDNHTPTIPTVRNLRQVGV
jgi:hypothetical protein